ncbi:MAG TPA: hypothetical protein VF744_20295 [Beijerinckiaceae bacterium]|jgi:cbb3-type cytochrome oxidase subunit 1
MRRIDTFFVLTAAACLIGGVGMGIFMGIAHDFQFAPVHAHLNLLGWASLALFGLVYKAWPALAQSRIALAHFALAAPSALVFPVGIYLSIAHQNPGLAIGASLLWLAGAVAFFANLLRVFVFAAAPVRAPEAREAMA